MNLSLMKRIARNSDHKTYNHCALIFASGRLLSYGYNTGTLHAEESAIRRLDRLYRTNNSHRSRNLHLISFMVKRRSGKLGTSIPCEECWEAIKKANIRTVTFYINEKWYTNAKSSVGYWTPVGY